MGRLEISCPIRTEKHGTDPPLRNHHVSARDAFVEAARFLGGHPFSLAKAKLTRYRKCATLDLVFARIVQRRVRARPAVVAPSDTTFTV